MSKLKVNQIEAQAGSNVFLTGSLTVSETIIAREVRTSITSSQILVSGSTKFGDTADDSHQFTGSLNVTGSVNFANTATITSTLALGNYSDVSASLDTAEDTITANSASGHSQRIAMQAFISGAAHTARRSEISDLSSSVDTHLDANITALSSSVELKSEISLLLAV